MKASFSLPSPSSHRLSAASIAMTCVFQAILSTQVNIRGCSFEHTTHRELFMTNVINELLMKEKLMGANLSVGTRAARLSFVALVLKAQPQVVQVGGSTTSMSD